MGCNVREKHIRANRRNRSAKPDPEQGSSNNNTGNAAERTPLSKSIMESGIKPLNCFMGSHDSALNTNPSPTPGGGFDGNGWGYCTEEQLEDLVMKNLEFLYNEAILKLVSLGYDEDVALKAILKNGFCYGGMDVLNNILHNAISYLKSGTSSEESENNFTDLRQMQEYSLAGMVCILQQVKPQFSKGDAMWCLLMSDLNVGRASVMDIPVLPQPNGNGSASVSVTGNSNVEGVGNGPVGIPPAICRFHGGWGFGNEGPNDFNRFFSYSETPLQREVECPKRFNLSPSMKSLLKKNVATFAAGFRSNSKIQNQSQAASSLLPSGYSSSLNGSGVEGIVAKGEESQNSKNQDVVNSVLSKFRDLNLDESTEHGHPQMDQKDEIIVSLIHQIKDLERQAKERKEWAHQKAMQAARKLSNDLTELKMLRMEREETQSVKKGKQTIEDNTMKKLTEMENALRKASGEVDRANSAVKKLETENAEIRAEMEACKLSASESATTFMEVSKREKKCLKKISAWEKQKSKLQEDIASEKQKCSDLAEQLAQAEADQKKAEERWIKEQAAKEVALTQVEEERRLKEAAEAGNKRKQEALRLKIEIDFQRQKDDLQRLQQDLSRLKSSALSAEQHHQSVRLTTGNSDGVNAHGDIARLLHELDLENSAEKEVGCDRECILCLKDEVSVVFLPCAHQVVCANCNESYGKKGRAACPACRVPIEQRIRVFGATS
ncbi:PREDICTED: MND1-interacting protein 1-like isoform X1 [Ipomoea nil]|uniref:MND1-interacting protein 1-like isoform X1 n=1 Tax=Ipomoea nil TaxID=35883 RepID=UPI00090166D7|nr:PREDICTED: MND1-interacting protein 1-like isoform X1 [Ipomoea nil]